MKRSIFYLFFFCASLLSPLSAHETIHVYLVGIGLVGDNLLQQIENSRELFHNQYDVEIKVVAVANTKKMLFFEQGMDISSLKDHLKESGEEMSWEEFLKRMCAHQVDNPVFVDCTSSEMIAKTYAHIFQ